MQILSAPLRPTRMMFSPDGRYLAAGDDRQLRVWDLSTGSELWWHIRHLSRGFIFTPDGAAIVGGKAGSFRRYDVRTGNETYVPFLGGFDPDQFSPDGRFALAVTSDRQAHILRLRCARAVNHEWGEAWQKEIPFSALRIPSDYLALQFAADGNRLLRLYWRGASGRNGAPACAEVFEANTGERITEWDGDLPMMADLATVGPLGAAVLVHHRALYVVDSNDSRSKPVKLLNPSRKHFTGAAISRDGRWLATTSNDTAAMIWDATTWEVYRRCEWQIGRLRTVCFAPDGLKCAAGGDSGQIVVWDLDG